MRFRCLGMFAALSLVASGGSASAEDQVESVGGWTVITRPGNTGEPISPLCFLFSAPNEQKAQLRFINRLDPSLEAGQGSKGSAELRFVVTDPLPVANGSTLDNIAIAISGDQRSWNRLQARWTALPDGAGGYFSVFLDKDIEAIKRPLGRGHSMDVTFTLPDGEAKAYSVSLAGSGAALKAYGKCLDMVR